MRDIMDVVIKFLQTCGTCVVVMKSDFLYRFIYNGKDLQFKKYGDTEWFCDRISLIVGEDSVERAVEVICAFDSP